MRAVCSKRKSETSCTHDEQCEWKDGVCVRKLQDQLLRICRLRRGKEDLLRIMKDLGVPLPKIGAPTIQQLCSHIEIHLPALWEGKDIQTVKRKYNNIVLPPPKTPVIAAPISSTNVSYSTGDRVAVYQRVRNIMKKEVDDNYVCSLTTPLTKVRRIGTPSVYGKVFLVRYETMQGLEMAAKVMKNTINNANEVKLYNKFTEYVIKKRTPHMPLVFYDKTCHKCSDISGRGKCIAVLSELAQGDLRAWLEKGGITRHQLFSMIVQLIFALYAFERAGYTHHDLHWGNLLYHEQPEHEGSYIHYKGPDGEDVYVLHTGVLWTLWDFGLMQKSFDSSEVVQTDLFRILNFPAWAESHKYPNLPISTTWMKGMLRTCLTSTTVLEVLPAMPKQGMKRVFNDVFKMNPSQEWVSSQRIIPGGPFRITQTK